VPHVAHCLRTCAPTASWCPVHQQLLPCMWQSRVGFVVLRFSRALPLVRDPEPNSVHRLYGTGHVQAVVELGLHAQVQKYT
jgi:hypothetical protein